MAVGGFLFVVSAGRASIVFFRRPFTTSPLTHTHLITELWETGK